MRTSYRGADAACQLRFGMPSSSRSAWTGSPRYSHDDVAAEVEVGATGRHHADVRLVSQGAYQSEIVRAAHRADVPPRNS